MFIPCRYDCVKSTTNKRMQCCSAAKEEEENEEEEKEEVEEEKPKRREGTVDYGRSIDYGIVVGPCPGGKVQVLRIIGEKIVKKCEDKCPPHQVR